MAWDGEQMGTGIKIRKVETEVDKYDKTIKKMKKIEGETHERDEEQNVEIKTNIRKINNEL